MATMTVLDSVGASQTVEKPLTPGQAARTASRPVTLATEDITALTGTQTVSGTVTANAGTGTMAVSLASLPALPAGTNNIGDVDVLTMPTVTVTGTITANVGTGTQPVSGTVTANIGTMAALVAGTANIGDVDVLTLPALPAGTNNIGDVDVLTMPAVTVNGISTTAYDRGAGAATAQTARVTIDTGQVGALVAGGVPVVSGGYQWETIPVSSTNAIIGTTGASTDYLDNILVIVTDASNSHVWVSSGGTPASTDMVFPDNVGAGIGSYPVPIGNVGGPWHITTGSGAIARCSGKFT